MHVQPSIFKKFRGGGGMPPYPPRIASCLRHLRSRLRRSVVRKKVQIFNITQKGPHFSPLAPPMFFSELPPCLIILILMRYFTLNYQRINVLNRLPNENKHMFFYSAKSIPWIDFYYGYHISKLEKNVWTPLPRNGNRSRLTQIK